MTEKIRGEMWAGLVGWEKVWMNIDLVCWLLPMFVAGYGMKGHNMLSRCLAVLGWLLH